MVAGKLQGLRGPPFFKELPGFVLSQLRSILLTP